MKLAAMAQAMGQGSELSLVLLVACKALQLASMPMHKACLKV